MRTITVKMNEDVVEEVDIEADNQGVTRSEHLRNIVQSRNDTSDHEKEIKKYKETIEEYEETIEDYEHTIDKLEQTIQRLRNKNELILERDQNTKELQTQHEELVETIKEERSITEEKAKAGIVTRMKWWVTGLPENTENTE